MHKLEIDYFTINSAVIAQENGADSVEICDGIEVGGTTPDLEITKKVSQLIYIYLIVIIRPRGGNFVYSEIKFEKMKREIIEFKKLKVNEFVLNFK